MYVKHARSISGQPKRPSTMETSGSPPSSGAVRPSNSSSLQPAAGSAEKESLPEAFNPDDCGVKLRLLKTGLTVEYLANTDDEKNACSVRTHVPVPLKDSFYFEVSVDDGGARGNIGVGLCGKDVRLGKMPGWEKNSWGYHGDDGMLFLESGRTGHKYGPKYTTGDVVGCGVDIVNRLVFFTKNGEHLGKAFDVPLQSPLALYPTVGMQSMGGRLTANFGNRPFVYDVRGSLKQESELARR